MNPNNLPDDTPIVTFADLCLFLGGSPDSFTGQLLSFIGKADQGSQSRLAEGFPQEVWSFWLWQIADGKMTVGDYVRGYSVSLLRATAGSKRTE